MQVSRILGLDVAGVDQQQLLRQVHDWVSFGHPGSGLVHTLSYVNAHCLNVVSQDRNYFEALRSFDLIYPDGEGAVWASRWLGMGPLHKITGADWIFDFCELAQKEGWGVYVMAGKPGVAQTACANLLKQYPSLCILGIRDGYFREMDESRILREIEQVRPDVLFVGMGVPLQEIWITQWRNKLSVKICWAVGALFDYVAGKETRAPVWLRKHSLEWLWRMAVDPLGKWKRYLLGNPMFIVRIICQKYGI